jgi:hypothetical protein
MLESCLKVTLNSSIIASENCLKVTLNFWINANESCYKMKFVFQQKHRPH